VGRQKMAKTGQLLVCDCARSMKLKPAELSEALGASSVKACHALCRADSGVAEKALASGDLVLIACEQEAAFFRDMAEDACASDRLVTADIRDRAGWTADGDATAKQAALLADAALDRPATPVRDVTSEGVCLVIGAGEAALAAARRLAELLDVTCVLSDPPDDMFPDNGFDLAKGKLRQASGAFAGFEVVFNEFAPLNPSGRGALEFEPARDGARAQCDIIVDLTGEPALFPAPQKRDGYLRADPGDLLAVERVLFEAAQLNGTFEKPLHIRFHPELCAHSRAGQPGCNKCLDVCPTSAITPDGDTVLIDASICAGCGACAAVCPSGAASYDDPAPEFLFRRLRTLAQTFQKAGGTAPRALYHDEEHGSEMIRLCARYGRGLPANVIPVEVANVEGVGHAELLCALGAGFAQAIILAGPKTDHAALDPQIALAVAIMEGTPQEGDRISLISPAGPDDLENLLYTKAPGAMDIASILPLGGRRDVTRLAATALAGDAPGPIPLPDAAPYGAVAINTDACTLCLACVSLCPVGALADNPDRPQVSFQESACLQCGICANTCPENAITLEPRLDLSKAALSHHVLHEEEPFACIECGTEFGVRSTIERVIEKLEGKNWMYTGSDNTRLIQMCDDCRIRAQDHVASSPFRMGERPMVRTTDDYIKGKFSNGDDGD
jgi:ferredoxin